MMFLISQKLRKTRDEKSWGEEIYYTSMTNNTKNCDTQYNSRLLLHWSHIRKTNPTILYASVNQTKYLQSKCPLLLYEHPHILLRLLLSLSQCDIPGSQCIIISIVRETPSQNYRKVNRPVKLLTMHAIFLIRDEHRESPEGFFFIEVHEKKSCNLRHPLAVAYIYIVHTVCSKNIEELLLFQSVTLTKHPVVTVSSVDIEVYLADVWRPAPR